MSFKDWFNEDDHDIYNYPDEAMEAAWDAGSSADLIAEQAKNLKLCQRIKRPEKDYMDLAHDIDRCQSALTAEING